MMIYKKHKHITTFITYLILLATVLSFGTDAYAMTTQDYLDAAEERKSLPIQSDSIENWPAGPKIGAESALLMEANTGVILYEKNINEQLYPASVTKILTALVAVEQCDMDETVTFSDAAIHSINWKEDANMGINAGDSITMEQCLYGLLVGSANEVAYAIAEHICGEGNIQGFADLMNKKAEELGCTNSHFVTPNGIHDEDHYTSAHDLGLIAQAFFSNELLCKMSSTVSYHVPKSPTQPRDDMIVWAKSKLHPGKEYAYPNLVGTKTGYTDYARQTLVSCAERDGLKLICVIMKEESPSQFSDTVELFDYGFDNFQAITIADKDTTYAIQSLDFFSTSFDFFGSSQPILQLNSSDYLVLPVGADFNKTESELTYDNLNSDIIAKVNYYYNNAYVGCCSIEPAYDNHSYFDFGPKETVQTKQTEEEDILVINVKKVILIVIMVSLLLIVFFIIRSVVKSNTRSRRRRNILRKYKPSGTQNLDWKNFK